MITLDQILSSLPTLTAYELGEIRRQATVLLSLGGGAPSTQTARRSPGEPADSTDYTDEDLVLQAICKIVRLSNGSPVQPPMLKRASGTMATLRESLPGLIEYMKPIDERHRVAFFDTAVALLVENIKKQGIPVTPVVVIRQLHRLPAVVDLAFPGYYHNGNLNRIIRAYEGRSA